METLPEAGGSVIPFFREIVANGGKELPITDYRMTRFWISLDEGVQLVIKALSEAKGGEIFISKIPSFKITDLAQAILPDCEMPEVGIREGENYMKLWLPEKILCSLMNMINIILYIPILIGGIHLKFSQVESVLNPDLNMILVQIKSGLQ